MGNCCASNTDYTKKEIDSLIKIQSMMRTYRARK